MKVLQAAQFAFLETLFPQVHKPAREQGRNMQVGSIALAYARACALGLTLGVILPAAFAQSTDQNFPTPIASTEISGTIKARDIGDSRLTSYFYAFDGGQGDIFINVVTKNFSGDIDVFNAEGLRPLTKMVIYADAGSNETGRLIYLRKGERLILRIEGRSPNDDPADFRIKFAGSFIALAAQKAEEAPTISRTGGEESGVRVNSVGTIIPSLPKPPPTRRVKEIVAVRVPAKPVDEPRTESGAPMVETLPSKTKETDSDSETVFENKSAKVTVAPAAKPVAKRPPKATPPKAAKSTVKIAKQPDPLAEKKPNPLASIRLIVQLKDGEVIERSMNEVVKFSVDNGVLTILLKGGRTTRYSILDVAKITIE